MRARPLLLALATASFVAYFVFLILAIFYAREPLGLGVALRPAGVYAIRVTPGLAAARAGFADDDRIVSAFGLPIGDLNDLNVANANLPLHVETVWQLERNGAPITATLAPLSRRWTYQGSPYVLMAFASLLSLALGLLVAWRGPQDASSRLGAWLLASLGCVYLPLFPRSMLALWRDLPAPLELLLWPVALSSISVHLLLFAFCARVPKPLLGPWAFALALAPGVGVVAYVAVFVILAAYWPALAIELPIAEWFNFAGPLTYPAYFFAAALMLVKGVRRATDPTDRRRAQTLLAGVIGGATGLLIFALLIALQQTGRADPWLGVLLVAVPIFGALPLSFAYAMLRHRLFDLRVIVRLGLQYALVRGLVLALVPLAIVALVVDVLLHGDQSLRAVLADRGWTYGTIAISTMFAYSQRQPWMTTLDRRFFRERYAAQQILREVVEEIGRAADLETAVRGVVSKVEAALHPTVVAVMRKPRSMASFVATATLPETSTVAPLSASNAVTRVVRALGRPVAFGTQGLKDLPEADKGWLAQSEIELVVPILTDEAKDEVLLVLGPRRSEEPYSQEDLDLLGAIAASLALLPGRSSPASSSDLPTTTGMSPRRLGNRYRLEALIGEGGMGVVYAAIDETLGRSVAVKLVREEQLRSREGLERFQREARAAASLSHPNIVIVHDFGVEDGGAPYLVMERLVGRSLRNTLTIEGRMAPDRARAILQGVAAAMEAAHARGMVHRDLKPENVFLCSPQMTPSQSPGPQITQITQTLNSPPEIAKVLDFGIAKISGASDAVTGFATASGVLVGTLPYMSPEQIEGGMAVPAWDVWSLTVIAFEMLGGVHPFNARGGSGMPTARPSSIRSHAPDLPVEVDAFFERALSRDVSQRPGTASALFTELHTSLRSAPPRNS